MAVLVLVAGTARARGVAADFLARPWVLGRRPAWPRFGYWRASQRAEQRFAQARSVAIVGIIDAQERIDVAGEKIG